jgi:hypothetical protein
MKYLDERVEDLEKEVKLLKAKNKLEETKKPDYLFSHSDQEFITKFGLETTFASSWDSSEISKNSLDTIAVNLSSIADHNFSSINYVDSSNLPDYYPPYPDVISSWDESFNDVITENITDEFGFKMNYDKPNTALKSDKADKDIQNYLNFTEKKIEKLYGKIISKFKFLNHQWEMDGYGYVVNTGNNKKIIVTNHGKPIAVDKSYIETKISEYKEVIQETQRALFLIK